MKSQIILIDKNCNRITKNVEAGFTLTPKALRAGFTLIEILVVLAIIGAIMAAGSLIDFGTIGRASLGTERDMLVSILQKARDRSINNMDHEKHGVHIDSNNYILFRCNCSTYTPSSTDEPVPRNNKIIITTSPLGKTDFVFSQLSGEPETLADISLSDGVNTKVIKIKNAGLIDW